MAEDTIQQVQREAKLKECISNAHNQQRTHIQNVSRTKQ